MSTQRYRRNIRLKGYDYSQSGLYFVTICTRNREPIFGEIVNGTMHLNDYGEIACNEWLKTSIIRPNVQLGEFVVMPNHFHGIIIITNDVVSHIANNNVHCRGVLHTPNPNDCDNTPCRGVLHTPSSDIVSNVHRGVCNTPLRSSSQTVGAIIRGYKSALTKQLNKMACFGSVWQRNYHEHIIRNNHSCQYISNYIANNPATWEKDRYGLLGQS